MAGWMNWLGAQAAGNATRQTEQPDAKNELGKENAERRNPRGISIVNQKGGVGKTTLSFHLSGALGELGYRVLAVDCDSQGSLSATFQPTHESLPVSIADIFAGHDVPMADLIQHTTVPGVDLLPADERLDRFDRTADYEASASVHALGDALSEIQAQYDFLIFDCPPRRSLTTFATLAAANEVVIPVEAHALSLYGIVKLQQKVEDARKRLNPHLTIRGFVLSRYHARASFQRTYGSKLEQVFGAETILATIPEARILANAMSFRQPITLFAPKSTAAAAVRTLAQKILHPPSHGQIQTAGN